MSQLQGFMSELNKVVQTLPGFEPRLATLTPVQKQVPTQAPAQAQAQAQAQVQAQSNIAASFQSGPAAGPTTVPVDMITTNDELANPNIIVVSEITVPR